MNSHDLFTFINDHEIDCYHQYVAQTNHQPEQPKDGDAFIINPESCEQVPNRPYNPLPPCTYEKTGHCRTPTPDRPLNPFPVYSYNKMGPEFYFKPNSIENRTRHSSNMEHLNPSASHRHISSPNFRTSPSAQYERRPQSQKELYNRYYGYS